MKTQQTEKKMPWKWYVVIFLVGLSVLMVTVVVPIWHWFPVQITEEGTIIAITENGCVIDTPSVTPPIIQQCEGKIGEVIEVTYYVPAKATSGYFEKLQQRAELVQP